MVTLSAFFCEENARCRFKAIAAAVSSALNEKAQKSV
jgi:hypothetical protein